MSDYIDRQWLLDVAENLITWDTERDRNLAIHHVRELAPSADVVNKTDLLGWLLAYHTKSFELKGRYLPHEVIGWLVNDLSKNLLEKD